jgi:cytochrome c peroxidase
MKKIILLSFVVFVLVIQVAINGCNNTAKTKTGELPVKEYYKSQNDSIIKYLLQIDTALKTKFILPNVQQLFSKARSHYKKTEAITEYYFQGLTKRINGPALPDVKTEDGQVWPPHGFQVIEQIVFGNEINNSINQLSNEIKILETDLRFVKANIEYNTILPQHITELTQHQLIRIATLGITGFDTPMSQQALQESIESIIGIEEINKLYNNSNTDKIKSITNESTAYVKNNLNFENFDRLFFLTQYLIPLSDSYYADVQAISTDSIPNKPFYGTLGNFLKGENFNPDYYSTYAVAKTNKYKVTLGQKLFFDNNLSSSAAISCGSCHKPDLYFTDGKQKANNFIHGGTLLRNTPTLYYSSLQNNQFYDLRSVTLEDQIDEVMKNKNEFNFNATHLAKKLMNRKEYLALFQQAFPKNDSITSFHIRNAIAAFVRSLNPFSSKLDAYFKGNKTALNTTEIKGFNLFMGKAKCGTCHFMPLFNGNVPPWYNKSESEIIGVPNKAIWAKASIDKDSGRYTINKMQELLYAFKTPTIRNVEKTAPYMHNGVYNTLDEIVEFYHKGGGVGIGIDLPFQSLPFDSLILNDYDKKAIVAFMITLTDSIKKYN